MKIRDIIVELKKQGYSVKFKDYGNGQGIYITEISGKSFTRSEGNKKARELLGVDFNARQTEQRRYAAREKQRQRLEVAQKIYGNLKIDELKIAMKKDKDFTKKVKQQKPMEFSKELLKEFRKTQKLWREHDVQGHGKITRKKLRQHVQRYGESSAIEVLRTEQRYAQGYAYYENVDHLIDRLTPYLPEAQELIDLIESKRDTFKDVWINEINEIFYAVDGGRISIDEGINRAISVIK